MDDPAFPTEQNLGPRVAALALFASAVVLTDCAAVIILLALIGRARQRA